MKLAEIRGLIRKTSGNPKLVLALGNAAAVEVIVQKVPFLTSLGEAFGDDKKAETGLTFDPETLEISEIETCRPTPAIEDEDSEDPFDTADGTAADYAAGEDDEDDLL